MTSEFSECFRMYVDSKSYKKYLIHSLLASNPDTGQLIIFSCGCIPPSLSSDGKTRTDEFTVDM